MRSHTHYCVNKSKGCRSSYECRLPPEGAPDCPLYCSGGNHADHEPCEDCFTSVCDECGRTLNIERHERDCANAATGDGAAV